MDAVSLRLREGGTAIGGDWPTLESAEWGDENGCRGNEGVSGFPAVEGCCCWGCWFSPAGNGLVRTVGRKEGVFGLMPEVV